MSRVKNFKNGVKKALDFVEVGEVVIDEEREDLDRVALPRVERRAVQRDLKLTTNENDVKRIAIERVEKDASNITACVRLSITIFCL